MTVAEDQMSGHRATENREYNTLKGNGSIMTTKKILAISGSLRADSHNTALARAAQKYAPNHVQVVIYENLRDLPHFDEDDEQDPHQAVNHLWRMIDEADGVLFVTPEYNHSVPGVLKNAIDWASRPPGRSALTCKPIAIAGAGPGEFGPVRAQLALREMLVGLDADVVYQPEVVVFRAHERLNVSGNLVDDFTVTLLQDLLTALSTRTTRS